MYITIKDLIRQGERILKASKIDNAGNDAETLLGFLAGFDKQQLFMNQGFIVDDFLQKKYLEMIERRSAGEPLQYITGEQYFLGHRFSVDSSVLIIRPETEILAEKAISYLFSNKGASDVLDLCTGSGVLAVSIAKACPDVRITASDISAGALSVAMKNARSLDVCDRIDFIQSDLFKEIKNNYAGKEFDLIVTNPPYIRSGDIDSLQKEIREYEPVLALDGGIDGLDFYRAIASEAGGFMRPNACILAEVGHDQAADVLAIFRGSGFKNLKVYKDLSGFDRIIEGVKC